MKRAASDELTKSEETKKICLGLVTQSAEEPFLPIELVGKILLDSFRKDRTDPITLIREQIITFYLINRELYEYIQSPNNTRIIMNNATICGDFLKPFIAKNLIDLPPILNYVKQTQKLHAEIDKLSIEDIRNLIVQNGADVNYYGSEKSPLLSKTIDNEESSLLLKTIDNYDKTECLMELGADPYLGNLLDKNCAFTESIKKEKIGLLNLFIKHYPYYRVIQFYDSFETVIGENSIDIALDTKNIELIKSVLNQKNIPFERLKKVLFYAHENKIIELIKLLSDRGIAIYEGD